MSDLVLTGRSGAEPKLLQWMYWAQAARHTARTGATHYISRSNALSFEERCALAKPSRFRLAGDQVFLMP